mgnify:CR=1 FL=1
MWESAIGAARAYFKKRKIPVELADDVISEAAIRAMNAIQAGKTAEPLAGWLVTASKLVLKEVRRKSRTQQRILQHYLRGLRREPEHDNEHLTRPGLQVLMNALLELTTAQLLAVNFTVFRGWNIATSARALGITPQALSENKAKALRKLKVALERKGQSLTSMTDREWRELPATD